jgi:undecaprenyl-diphosphatase
VPAGEPGAPPRNADGDQKCVADEDGGRDSEDDVVPGHEREYDTRVRRRGLRLTAAAALIVAFVLSVFGVGEVAGVLSNWQAFVLGLVQGFTELLPVSSSGHLILVPWLGNWTYLEQHPDFNKTFDVALHLGTLIAVVAYFWDDIAALVTAWLRSVRQRQIRTTEEKTAWCVLAATIPASIIGAIGESTIQKRLGEPWQIAIFLAVFGVLLWIADRRPEEKKIADLTLGPAIAVGLAQAVALAPGVSRSGITITMARALRFDRDAAARFSFLLLVPVVLGAVVYKGWTDVIRGTLPDGWIGPFVVGTLAAAGSGLFAIEALLGYVRRHDYSIFVIYRLAVAAFILLLIASGVRDATF